MEEEINSDQLFHALERKFVQSRKENINLSSQVQRFSEEITKLENEKSFLSKQLESSNSQVSSLTQRLNFLNSTSKINVEKIKKQNEELLELIDSKNSELKKFQCKKFFEVLFDFLKSSLFSN